MLGVWVHLFIFLSCYKGNTFMTSRLLPRMTKPFQKGVYSFICKSLLLSFKSWSLFRREAKLKMVELLPLKIYPFTLINWKSPSLQNIKQSIHATTLMMVRWALYDSTNKITKYLAGTQHWINVMLTSMQRRVVVLAVI